VITVTTYKELEFYVQMFKDGNSDLLILESSGGLGKSTTVDGVMESKRHLKILSHTTPLKLYIMGFLYQNCPVIFDDLDTLIQNKQNVALLKQFSETQKIKEINWFTTSKILQSLEIPEKYETKSKVMIICNSFDLINKNVSSLTDRGFHIRFKPNKEEILAKIREIAVNYKDEADTEEIIQLIEKYGKFSKISLRTLIKGIFLWKQDKDNFRDRLLQEMEINPKLVLLDKLIREYPNDKERLKNWQFGRATYYRHKSLIVS